MTFDGKRFIPGYFSKSRNTHALAFKNHAFVDGNKRTAYSSCGIFLKLNGYKLENMHKRSLEFAMNVENNSLELEQISKWLKKHSKKI